MVRSIGFMTTLAFAAPSLAVEFTPIEVDGRSVDVWVPECARPNAPIIVALHAWATDKETQQSVDRLPDYAGPECAIIVYPQGKSSGVQVGPFGLAGHSWNAGGCCPQANLDKIDDVGFLDRVVTAVAAEFNADEQSVFAIGISNGGMMANRFACTNEKVKAMVAVSGPLMSGDGDKTESFECSRSIPMLHMHGDADPVVPYKGCSKDTSILSMCREMAAIPGGGFPQLPWPSIPEALADWRVRNGIAAEAEGSVTFANASASCTSWGEASNNVTLCTMGGEGHAWPGSCSGNILATPIEHCSLDMDASFQAMEFFRQYMPQTSSVV